MIYHAVLCVPFHVRGVTDYIRSAIVPCPWCSDVPCQWSDLSKMMYHAVLCRAVPCPWCDRFYLTRHPLLRLALAILWQENDLPSVNTQLASYLPASCKQKWIARSNGVGTFSEPSVRRGTVDRNVNTCHATLECFGAVEPYPWPDLSLSQISGDWAVQPGRLKGVRQSACEFPHGNGYEQTCRPTRERESNWY